MDLNLHLLTPDQVRLIQEISLQKGSLNGFTGFEEVRNKVSLVILDEETGYGMFEENLNEEEKGICREIEKEKDRRRRLRDDERREEWPSLPYYDPRESEEHLFADWYDEMDDDPIFRDWEDDENWLREQEERRLYLYGEIQEGRRGPVLNLTDDAVSYGMNGLDNFALIQMDARLGQIKWFRKRLTKSRYWVANPLIDVSWAAHMMGCYCVRRKSDGSTASRTVYLFIDIIRAYASSKSVSEENVIAEIYTHEMFHAFYDDLKSKNFISAYLKGVREVEEAMTEYGMLSFLERFYPAYLKFAQSHVKEKLTAGDPMLQCYGFGEYLFRTWNRRFFGNDVFGIYQKISPAPRLSVRLVRRYVRMITRSAAGPVVIRRCMKMLYLIIDYFDAMIPSPGKHFSFDGRQYGYSNRMVYAVLNYYARYTGNGFADMVKDFDNYNVSLYGPSFAFEEVNRISPDDINLKYDPKAQIALADGTAIIPAKTWFSSNGSNTSEFLTKVKELHLRGVLDKSVNVLR